MGCVYDKQLGGGMMYFVFYVLVYDSLLAGRRYVVVRLIYYSWMAECYSRPYI